MIRSASFHYPDGESRIQRNVYSSEDEDYNDESNGRQPFRSLNWKRSELVEVNDDEFILPIGNASSYGRRGIYDHPVESEVSAASSSPMGRRLEALDSLVINTVFSMSARLCKHSAQLVKKAQENIVSEEQLSIMDTLVRMAQLISVNMG